MGELLRRIWDRLNGIEPGLYACCQHCDHDFMYHRDAPCLHKGCEQHRERPEHHGLAA